jgi:hypothetical protein
MDVYLYKIKFSSIWSYRKTIVLLQSFFIVLIPSYLYIVSFESLNIAFKGFFWLSILLMSTTFLCTFIFAFINYEDLSSKG